MLLHYLIKHNVLTTAQSGSSTDSPVYIGYSGRGFYVTIISASVRTGGVSEKSPRSKVRQPIPEGTLTS